MTWNEKLDSGQLDMMWSFLQFKGDGAVKEDVDELTGLLDELRTAMVQKLRTAMVQKSAGQSGREPKIKGAVDFGDVPTIINSIVISAMELYLSGGLGKLREVLPSEKP